MLWGWRLPEGIEGLKSGAFADWSFLTEIIKTLSVSVRHEHPKAQIIHNFHTDLSPKLLHRLGLPSWPEAVEWWRPYLDIIGLDLYPNYYDADKNYKGNLATQVEKAKVVGCGRPVMIMETNYPRGPGERAFEMHKQASYVQTTIKEAKASGAEALLFYGAVSLSLREDHDHFTRAEKRLMKNLGKKFEQGDLFGLGLTLLWHNRLVKSGELGKLLTSVEPYWDFLTRVACPYLPMLSFGMQQIMIRDDRELPPFTKREQLMPRRLRKTASQRKEREKEYSDYPSPPILRAGAVKIPAFSKPRTVLA